MTVRVRGSVNRCHDRSDPTQPEFRFERGFLSSDKTRPTCCGFIAGSWGAVALARVASGPCLRLILENSVSFTRCLPTIFASTKPLLMHDLFTLLSLGRCGRFFPDFCPRLIIDHRVSSTRCVPATVHVLSLSSHS